jgi:serine/threonine-protein kinase
MNTPSLIGMQVDQYRIESHLARGGMADVYIARDVHLDRLVAFKILLSMLAQDAQYVKRFQREAQAVARLDHPNIVKVYSTGLMPAGQPYIAMQYVQGGSMREQLLRWQQYGKVAPAPQSLAIIRHLGSALDTAHRAGIVHRDLKPSNVLIRPNDGMPVLVDLGIAAIQGSEKLTQTGSLIGTPHYMSPEQVRGEKVDGRSDIYSLGVILYELLAGVRPFEADESIAILHKHVYEAPPPIDQLRPGLSGPTLHVVTTCLQKDPANRFQTSEGLTNAIDRALQVEGQQGYILKTTVLLPEGENELISRSKVVKPPSSQAPPKQKRSKLWLALLVVVVLVVSGGILALNILGSDAPTPPADDSPLTPVANHEGVPAIVAEVTEISEITEVQEATEITEVIEATGTIAPTEQSLMPTEVVTDEPTVATVSPTETATTEPTATSDLGPERSVVGETVLGTPMEIVRFGAGPKTIVFVGGLHAGAAPSTVSLAQRAIIYFTDNPQVIPPMVTLYVIPNANPDSPYAPGELAGRLNANSVDLNRNWDCRWTENATWRGNVIQGSGGPAPFSEPETQALRDFILDYRPAVIVFWEARAQDGLSSPGTCGSRPLVSLRPAEIYGIAAGYPIADFEDLTNQVLNGDGTNWIDQQGIPAIAVLLPEYENVDWNNNLAGMRAILDAYAN